MPNVATAEQRAEQRAAQWRMVSRVTSIGVLNRDGPAFWRETGYGEFYADEVAEDLAVLQVPCGIVTAYRFPLANARSQPPSSRRSPPRACSAGTAPSADTFSDGVKDSDVEDLFSPGDYVKLYSAVFGTTLKASDLNGNDRIIARNHPGNRNSVHRARPPCRRSAPQAGHPPTPTPRDGPEPLRAALHCHQQQSRLNTARGVRSWQPPSRDDGCPLRAHRLRRGHRPRGSTHRAPATSGVLLPRPVHGAVVVLIEPGCDRGAQAAAVRG
ncbi:hypothetical protein ACVWZD_008999 [Streptomyces sp. TE3672]